jgi:GNAT superfamily N-acetyltransferase
MSYSIAIEDFDNTYHEIEVLYREHYNEMAERLAKNEIIVSPYNPRIDEYSKACKGGWLITMIARCDGKAVGYCNVYITNDMHNRDLIAQEDTLFVTKEHRNGIGKKLVQFGIEELRKRGVKRLNVSAMTDLRVAKLWERMGFKNAAYNMIYTF